VFNNTIKHVDINPYWNVPASIARNEILPKQQKDPLHLKKNHMRMFQGWDSDAPEIDASTIDWNKMTRNQMDTYRIRQDPGPHNALGTLKLMFPNEYNVYLHDTPAHDLFRRDRRTFSHGCIRMERPAEMAAYVLGGEENGWTVKRIKDLVATQKRHVFRLKKPMPVFILYRTALVDADDGSIYFYEDVYGRDKVLAQALFRMN
jgi:murein L,D-transpeptidase YcbB/YkuD